MPPIPAESSPCLVDVRDQDKKIFQRNYRRADKDALRTHVPHIEAELDQALGVLNELEVQLPAIRTQAAHLHRLYDSSRDKVRLLTVCVQQKHRRAISPLAGASAG
jgi:peptidoglycan hydrolase CwlO-like protein